MELFPESSQPLKEEKKSEHSAFRDKARTLLKTIGISAALSAGGITQAEAQKNEAVPPIITHDASDPRVKAYNDSLYAYKKGEQYFSDGVKVFMKGKKAFDSFEKKESPMHDSRVAHLQPGRFEDYGHIEFSGPDKNSEWKSQKEIWGTKFPFYKKPIQPVFAEEPKNPDPIVVTNPNDPKLKKYQDSLYAHETFEVVEKELEKLKITDIPGEEKRKKADSFMLRTEDLANDPRVSPLDPRVTRDAIGKRTYPILHYQKPVQEVRYEKPAPEYFKETPLTYPVYGPKGGLLGTVTESGGFTPLASGDREHLKDGLGVHADDEKILEEWDKGQANPYLSTQGVKIEEKK